MRIQVFQHVPFEDPSLILDWAQQRGHAIIAIRWFSGDPPSAADDIDMLLIMGGPMGVLSCWMGFVTALARAPSKSLLLQLSVTAAGIIPSEIYEIASVPGGTRKLWEFACDRIGSTKSTHDGA